MNNCNGTADPAASVSRRAEKRTAQEIETIRRRQLQSGWPLPNLAAHFREAAAGAEGVSDALQEPSAGQSTSKAVPVGGSDLLSWSGRIARAAHPHGPLVAHS